MAVLDETRDDESPDVLAERIAFVAELVWEALPDMPSRAKTKRIVSEIAENLYVKHKGQFDDEIVKKGDWWVRSSYIINKWAKINTYLTEDGRYIASVVRLGVFGTKDKDVVKKDYDKNAKHIKKMADVQTERGEQYQKATGVQMDGIYAELKKLSSG